MIYNDFISGDFLPYLEQNVYMTMQMIHDFEVQGYMDFSIFMGDNTLLYKELDMSDDFIYQFKDEHPMMFNFVMFLNFKALNGSQNIGDFKSRDINSFCADLAHMTYLNFVKNGFLYIVFKQRTFDILIDSSIPYIKLGQIDITRDLSKSEPIKIMQKYNEMLGDFKIKNYAQSDFMEMCLERGWDYDFAKFSKND